MSLPHATVVIPCFNHGRYLRQAVDSALRQEGAEVRVVVVDDGSDDGATPRACDDCAGPRVEVIHQPNRGLPAARNRGAREATSEYLVFLDADDWIEPTFVAQLHQAIRDEHRRGHGDVAYAYCEERLVGTETGVWRVPAFDPLLMMVMNIHPVTTLVLRERFEAAGGFDETMTEGYEDWDLWLTLVERGWRGVRVQQPLFVYRRHGGAMMHRVERHHVPLYRRLVAKHRGLYERHGTEVAVRANAVIMHERRAYEAMLAVRMHKAFHLSLSRLPAPVSHLARRALLALRRPPPVRGEPSPQPR